MSVKEKIAQKRKANGQIYLDKKNRYSKSAAGSDQANLNSHGSVRHIIFVINNGISGKPV